MCCIQVRNNRKCTSFGTDLLYPRQQQQKDPMVTDLSYPSRKQTKHTTHKNTPWFLVCCIQVRNQKMYLTGSIFCIHIRNERCTSLIISDVSTSETNKKMYLNGTWSVVFKSETKQKHTSLVPDLLYPRQCEKAKQLVKQEINKIHTESRQQNHIHFNIIVLWETCIWEKTSCLWGKTHHACVCEEKH